MTNEKLISAICGGDTEAFKEIVKRYESRVAQTVIGMLGQCPEAEDVGQETFIRFYRGLKHFRGDSSIETYLTRIAINLSLNELKRRRRRMLFFPTSSEALEDLPDENFDMPQEEMKEIVQLAIQKLEPKFRSVIVLRLMDGYSTEETAKILKIPVGTVLSRLARAQKKLKELLQPYFGEER